MYKRPSTTVLCAVCKKAFEKENREINKGRHCCSRSCASILAISAKAKALGYTSAEDVCFASYLSNARRRTPGTNLTIKYLKEIYYNEQGKCPYIGISISLKTKNEKVINPVTTASLDRIDSTLPYEKGNVQFISLSMNYAKNRYDERYILELITTIKKYSPIYRRSACGVLMALEKLEGVNSPVGVRLSSSPPNNSRFCLMAKTLDFESRDRGSIPLLAAKQIYRYT